MRFPDPRTILEAPRRVLQAFPWTAGAALVLCGALDALNHSHGTDTDQFLSRLSMAAGWGVSLCFLVEILSRARRRGVEIALRMAPVAILGAWFVLVEHPLGMAQWSQFTLMAAATHLAVSLAGGADETRFWQWNRLLFQRIIESVAFSLVLGAGASGALWTLEKLFSVDLPNDTWGDLWIFVWSIFATFHFLSGIPTDSVKSEESYPLFLKLFSTRVLLPLAMVYLVLLYVYLVKIVATWTLPVGLVSTPVLTFAGFGILAQLLLHPLASGADRWVRLWTRWFQVLLLPLCGLLLVAIGRRLWEYGITEERYAVLVLALWLPVQSIWFLTAKRSLRFVPASLMILCLVCGWGPWGAFEVSRRSQLDRLESMLAEIHAVPGQKTSGRIAWKTSKEITSVVEYLCEHHQGRGIEKWSASVERIRERVDQEKSGRYRSGAMSDSVLIALGVPRVGRWESDTTGTREVEIHWDRIEAVVGAWSRMEAIDANSRSNLLQGMSLVVVKDGMRMAFALDTLCRLGEGGSSWKSVEVSLVLRDSAGKADLVLEKASLHRDGTGKWNVESLRGILLR